MSNLVAYSPAYAPATGTLTCTYDASTGAVTGLALAGSAGVCPGDAAVDIVIGDGAVVSQVQVAAVVKASNVR